MASKERPRCGGKWTEAMFVAFVKSQLRAATRKWKPISDCLKKARVSKGVYHCALCEQDVPVTIKVEGKRIKNVAVDHYPPVVDVIDGFTTWDDFINNLFTEENNLRLLCRECHNKVSFKDSLIRKSIKNSPSLSPEYNSWRAMRSRCLHKSHEAYERYGGKGITICDEWRNSFTNFIQDMGVRPEGTTLERIDNSKGYYLGNCRWATLEEQCNNRSNNIYYEHDGERKTLSQWSKDLNIPLSTLQNRLLRGYSTEKAFDENFVRGVKRGKTDAMFAMFDQGKSYKEVAEEIGCSNDYSRKTFYKYKKDRTI